MSIFKKSFTPGDKTPRARSAAAKPPSEKAPVTSPDNKRSFDARPKPSDDTRREERARPSQHVDPIPRDPLDPGDPAED